MNTGSSTVVAVAIGNERRSIVDDGGIVLMCGPCMREFGLSLEDVVPRMTMGKPGPTQGYIFADNARTLTWWCRSIASAVLWRS